MAGSERRLLLLSDDPSWLAAAQQELAAHGGGLDRASSAQDALQRLVEPRHEFSHLLLEPSAAGPHAPDLLGLTSGETGSQVELVLLGDAVGLAKAGVPHAKTPVELPHVFREAQHRPSLPLLSTSDIAVSFSAADVDCRFQPVVRVRDRRAVGLETLVRLQHPDRGSIRPDLFVPQIERAGLSLRLTEAVAQRAMQLIGPALLAHHGLFLSINLPLDVLLLADAPARFDALRGPAGIPAASLLIELTESRPANDLAALHAAVVRWRQAGYGVAIDDLGPDMANQQELFTLPFSAVKLDKAVVLRSDAEKPVYRYVRHTVMGAKRHGLTVIAEGVENAAAWTRMAGLGVDQVQGFLVARPLPAAAVPAWLDAWAAQPGLPRDRDRS